MSIKSLDEVYSAREIAAAAGVGDARVIAAMGSREFVRFGEAVAIGRRLVRERLEGVHEPSPLFSGLDDQSSRSTTGPVAISSVLHLFLLALVLILGSFARPIAANILPGRAEGATRGAGSGICRAE